MTEADYIIGTNLTKLRIAADIIGSLQPDDVCGMDVQAMLEELYSLVEIYNEKV